MSHSDNKNTQINEIQYFGNVELYSTLVDFKHIYFHPESLYLKARHSNRTSVYGSNGVIKLSIPLRGGRNQKGLFKDVEIADDRNWQRIHWRSIHDSYRKSPWFEDLGWQVEALYQKPERFLLDWNLNTMRLAQKLMGLKLDILTEISAPSEKIMITSLNPQPSKPSDNLFPKYQQVFIERHGFIANLSILDLLFCEGPATIHYLRHLADYKTRS
jgi:hypothetical protein